MRRLLFSFVFGCPAIWMLAGCVIRPQLTHQWAAKSELAYQPKPGDERFDAIRLYQKERLLIALRASEETFSQEERSQALYIRTERGTEQAEVRVSHGRKYRLVALKGRIIRPDGSVEEIPRDKAIQQTSDHRIEDENGENITVFRFPNVTVGSILETSVLVERPSYYLQYETHVDTELPIRRYEFELLADEHLRYALKAYNTQQPISQSMKDGFWHLTWNASDIPGRHRESFEPHWTWRDLWWSFRIVGAQWGSYGFPLWRTWDDVMQGWGERAFLGEGDLFQGYRPLRLENCATVDAKVERATMKVAEVTDLGDWGSFHSVRKLQEVVNGRNATAIEKAFLLRKVLDDAGVEAWLAATNRSYGALFDKEFPSRGRFDHALVYLPPQPGLKGAVWIDPSCERCLPGELPYYSLGAEAVVFRTTQPLGKPVSQSAFGKVTGKPVDAGGVNAQYAVHLDASGNGQVRMTLQRTGTSATEWERALHRTARRTKEKVGRELAVARLSSAQLTHVAPFECETRVAASPTGGSNEARCELKLEFSVPELATSLKNRMIVPLSVFSPAWDDIWTQSARVQPMVHAGPDDWNELVRIPIPSGHQVAELPKAWSAAAPGITASLEVEQAGNEVLVRRRLLTQAGYFPPATYPARQAVVRSYQDARKAVVAFTRN